MGCAVVGAHEVPTPTPTPTPTECADRPEVTPTEDGGPGGPGGPGAVTDTDTPGAPRRREGKEESNSPRCGKVADAGLTRLRVPTTSPGEGCSRVCRLCVGLHGNGHPAPPRRTPRMPSASTISGDWPATLLRADDAAAASREWC
ncbi:hypothetical protein X777_03829 [Ooceraea biroi]|uniref:Uncharacterized protein n=1 Tax=Ooceraea biroi TaxID=2015173 RepID=A0A026WKE7_OOCBI|nr:hypothetical protein X777_03829 [Ooceraea biroi]